MPVLKLDKDDEAREIEFEISFQTKRAKNRSGIYLKSKPRQNSWLNNWPAGVRS